jgi:DNA-binding CsgD family transcriptional regulator
LDRLLDATRKGRSGALVLHGPPGVGKTALLERCAERARGFRTIWVTGAQSERDLAFAALHQFCSPVLDQLDQLPVPQRLALEVTFGMSEGAAPDRFFAGLAVLGLVSKTSELGPLLFIVDDAHWLDQASAQILAFVARRLAAEPVAVLFATREPGGDLEGLPELGLTGLPPEEARQLLRSAVPGPLDDAVAGQLLAETQGNPLALLELPRGLSAGRWAGGYGLPAALSPTEQVEESFLRRARELPGDSRRLLLLAATDPTAPAEVIRAAAAALGIGDAAVAAAVGSGLVEVGSTVRFRHPLVRSVLYRHASLDERRQVHRALAAATDPVSDPDRRAWHLGRSVTGPDDDVAAELERSAERARRRGGLAAAGAFLARAAALTTSEARRTDRALSAAETACAAGAFDDAAALLATVGDGSPLQQARAQLVRARIASAGHLDTAALLLDAASRFGTADVDQAHTIYLEAFTVALQADRLATDGGVTRVAATVAAALPSGRPPDARELLLQGLVTTYTEGLAAAAPTLRAALDAFCSTDPDLSALAPWHWLPGRIAAELWDESAWEELSRRGVERLRDTGALATLPAALTNQAFIHLYRGELAVVASLVDEIRVATEATGTALAPYAALLLPAVRGREAELTALADSTVERATARGQGNALAVAAYLRALLYNGLGRYGDAVAAVRHEADPSGEAGVTTRAVSELVEAAAKAGDTALASRALQRLTDSTRAAGTEWALGVEARNRALLAGDAAAEELYTEAVRRLASTGLRFELARAQLLYGEWLRRQRRRGDARHHLTAAQAAFEAMGADGFADRAGRAILATGKLARRRVDDTRFDLTPQERQIAELARSGLSNPEIATRLFVSPRTVEYHLGKVFAKLGIRTRGELGAVLGTGPGRGPGTP